MATCQQHVGARHFGSSAIGKFASLARSGHLPKPPDRVKELGPMGDGETTEWALETSMDVEFSVHIVQIRFMFTPRVETPTQFVTVGIAGSADDAMRLSR